MLKLYKLLLIADSNRKFVEVYVSNQKEPYFGWLRANELNMATRIDTNDWYVIINGVDDNKFMAYKRDIITIKVINSIPYILRKGWKLIDTIQS